MTERARVIVAEDHTPFRDGLIRLLGLMPEVELVGHATNGDDAVRLARTAQPDVVLMDLQMPGINGIEATRRILESSPQVAVIVLTMFDDDDSVFAAMRAGARGYLLKGATRAEIGRAIAAVAQGGAIFSPTIAQRMVAFFSTGRPRPTAEPFPELSIREREILELIGRGLNNSAIAADLVLSPKTVRNHISHIFAKLKIADRSQAIVRARDAGLGRNQPS